MGNIATTGVGKMVMLTNHRLRHYAGSELATLDLAVEFKRRGWDVYVGCFELSKSIKKLFDAVEVKWVNLNLELDLSGYYFDLMWGHHFTTFNRCLVNYKINVRQVIYSSLSPYEPLECPPIFANGLPAVFANSHETARQIVAHGVQEKNIYVFENCVPDYYFDKKVNRSGELKKVAIISNHIPEELLLAGELLKSSCEVDCYGFGYNSVLVTPELLSPYDLVVTIGRTVQQCFSCGIPVYCYDRFGGPGFISESNFPASAETNFSGRCCGKKLSAQELVADIFNRYPEAVSRVDSLKIMTFDRYRLSLAVEKALNFMATKPDYSGVPEGMCNTIVRQNKYFESLVPKNMLQAKEIGAAIGSFEDETADIMHCIQDLNGAGSESENFPVRAIAFYLPQFHAIPENDTWWGKGFTEWTNVKEGTPLFEGHYQPHKPGELGYYDLNDVSVLERQAALAKQHGVKGFCFYYYWFDGKRLLEKPVDQLLDHPEIDLPYCLCWANENWTRRWDGGESEILMKQGYSPELDFRFAEDLSRYFKDLRYIKVNGKPLVLVYRTDLIAYVEQRAQAWRRVWRDLGVGEVYLVRVESFKIEDPSAIGFDAACEFFPHQVDFSALFPHPYPQNITDVECRIADYNKLARQFEERPAPSYRRFRGVIPSWDNSARRRKGGATLLVNAEPKRYEEWIGKAIHQTLVEFDGDERLLFINAWNEWAEGCHLEPDVRHGRAYLEATLRAQQKSLRVDVDFERYLKPYQAWLSIRESAHQKELGAVGELNGFVFVIDATSCSRQVVDTTLNSIDALFLLGAKAFVVSPTRLSDSQTWIRCDKFCPSIIEDVASVIPGAWLCVLKGGDQVSGGPFRSFFGEILSRPDIGLAYADEDLVDDRKGRYSPKLKPDFDFDHFLSFDYVGRFIVFKSDDFIKLFYSKSNASSNFLYQYVFSYIDEFGQGRIFHYSDIVFHASSENFNLDLTEARKLIIEEHFQRNSVVASVENGMLLGSFRVMYPRTEQPLVSIIIPTRNQQPMLCRCIESLTTSTAYQNYEILIVDNNSDESDAVKYLQGLTDLGLEKIRVFSYPYPFNFSAMNNLVVREARGEYLVLLNNDTAIIKADWLDALLNHAQRPEVGAVGAKLVYPDGKVQHAGVVLGLRGPADHPFIGEAMNAPGYGGRLLLDQGYSAVTAACMMVRKSIYEDVGGMDENAFKVSYNDVDLCLKIKELGYSIIWTPYSLVMHVGNVSQKALDKESLEAKRQWFETEKQAMYRKWLPRIVSDPAYNKNFSLAGRGFELEVSPLFKPTALGQAKLYTLCADQFGSGLYRAVAPTSELIEHGFAVGGCGRAYLDLANVVKADPSTIVFQRQIKDFQIQFMKDYRNFTQAKQIFEIDDYLPNIPVASLHRAEMPKDVVQNLRQAMDLCDRIVVSTDALRDALEKWHSEIIVLPNYLPLSIWGDISLSSVSKAQGRPRVGWAGGLGHTGDLSLIADVVTALSDRVDWVFFGMLPEGMLNHVAEYHPGVAISDYPQSLASLNLDLALAPLEENLFNECKSNLRLLEYGICGYAVIASDCVPYRCGLPVTLVKNRFRDWVLAIEEKLADRESLRSEGLALQQAVRSKWLLQGDNLLRWRDGWLRFD